MFGLFPSLDVVNSAAINIYVQVPVFKSSGRTPRHEIVGHTVIL